MSKPDPNDLDRPILPEPGMKEPSLDHFFELVLRHEETRELWLQQQGAPGGGAPTLPDERAGERARLLRRTQGAPSQPNGDH